MLWYGFLDRLGRYSGTLGTLSGRTETPPDDVVSVQLPANSGAISVTNMIQPRSDLSAASMLD